MSLWKMTEIIHYTCCDSKVMLFFNRLSFHASSHHCQVILTSCNQLMWENVIGNVVYCTIFSTVCDFVVCLFSDTGEIMSTMQENWWKDL